MPPREECLLLGEQLRQPVALELHLAHRLLGRSAAQPPLPEGLSNSAMNRSASATFVCEPPKKGVRWCTFVGTTSSTAPVPVLAAPPACSKREVRGAHS